MRKGIVLVAVVIVAVFGSMYFRGGGEPASDGSPAFQALLDEAIARLEGVPEQVAAISVADARAEGMQTVSEYTCAGFRTCDAIPTCYGIPTCDGEETCWASTCADAQTCECGCSQYTLEGGETCDGTETCMEGCPGWPTYFAGWPTCEGQETCALTCPGYVSCAGGPSAVESTTWGQVKTQFSE